MNQLSTLTVAAGASLGLVFGLQSTTHAQPKKGPAMGGRTGAALGALVRVVPAPTFDGKPMNRALAQSLAGGRALSSWRSCSFFPDGRSVVVKAGAVGLAKQSAGATPCVHLVFVNGSKVEELFLSDRTCSGRSASQCQGGYRLFMKVVSNRSENRNPQARKHLTVSSTFHLADDPTESSVTTAKGSVPTGRTWAATLRGEGWHRFEPYLHVWGYSLADAAGRPLIAPVEKIYAFPLPSGGDTGCSHTASGVLAMANQFGEVMGDVTLTLSTGIGAAAGAVVGGKGGAGIGGAIGTLNGRALVALNRSVGQFYAWAANAAEEAVCVAVRNRGTGAAPGGRVPGAADSPAGRTLSECQLCTEVTEVPRWGDDTVEIVSDGEITVTAQRDMVSVCSETTRVNGQDADGDGWCD